MSKKRMLKVVGVKTIDVRSSPNKTKHAMVAVTISADGTILPSMVIFKGMPDGKIARTEFGTYLATQQYRCQENAWMDEHVMIDWVEYVLKPYVANAPDNVIPLLILDSYQCLT